MNGVFDLMTPISRSSIGVEKGSDVSFGLSKAHTSNKSVPAGMASSSSYSKKRLSPLTTGRLGPGLYLKKKG